ncbi:hypothetical protein [Lactiplantibacillus herbarum]|uniref:hypothetical protein n=1 Tax=Lactiplantibacillus herbarum TaxID=1670446 RepID=UPI000B0897CD|nr:hypothetical protein [Lactiplantibacillus herbarum]
MFYGVMLMSYLTGTVVQWYYREYASLLVLLDSITILFMGILGWYRIGSLVLLPIAGLWCISVGTIYAMNRLG